MIKAKNKKIVFSSIFLILFFLLSFSSVTAQKMPLSSLHVKTQHSSIKSKAINTNLERINKINSFSNSNTNLNFSFAQLTPVQINNALPTAWTSTITYAANGFITTGGDGMTFYGNSTFKDPWVNKVGYYTGSAWDGNEFLVVGQYYGPDDGALMGLYNPATNIEINRSNLFGSSLRTNATLYQTIWNGTSFIILGSANPAINPQTLFLYSYNPFTNVLNNISNLLPQSFQQWNGINAVSMLLTPAGIFVQITDSSWTRLGLLNSTSFNDLTNIVPDPNNMTTNKIGVTPTKNNMAFINGTLFVVDSYYNNSIVFFSYNPSSGNESIYYNQFNRTTGFVGALTYLDNYFFISGYNTTDNFPLMLAFQLNGTIINVLNNLSSTLSQTNNYIVSTATDGNNRIFMTYGTYPNAYFGIITVNAPLESTHNVTFQESGLFTNTYWSVTLAGSEYTQNTNQVTIAKPTGEYFYTISNNFLYTINSSSGWVYVNQSSVLINISYLFNQSMVHYAIFREIGLPSNFSWTVTINGKSQTSLSNLLEFNETPGTYTYTVSPIANYTIIPNSGIVIISQTNETVSIYFNMTGPPPNFYTVTFTDTGLPDTIIWSVNLNGQFQNTFSNSIAFHEVSGNYKYSINPIYGYKVNPNSGTVIVSQSNVNISITFTFLTSTTTSSINPALVTITINTTTPGLDVLGFILAFTTIVLIKRRKRV